MNPDVRRIESHHRFVSRQGLFRLALYEQHIAQGLVRERKIGIESERLFDMGFRDREFPQREIRPGRQAQEITVTGVFFQVQVAELGRHLQVTGAKLRHRMVELLFLIHSRSSPQACTECQTVLVPSA